MIALSIEKMKEKSATGHLNFVYCAFLLLFWQMKCNENMSLGRWRESVTITVQKHTESAVTLNGSMDPFFPWTDTSSFILDHCTLLYVFLL